MRRERCSPTNGGFAALAAYADGVLYVPSSDRSIRALDESSGEVRWTLPVDGDPSIPVVTDGRLIVGTNLAALSVYAGTDP